MEANDETLAEGSLPDAQFSMRHDLQPADINRVRQLHGREFLAEHGFGVRFEGYVAEGLGKFARGRGIGRALLSEAIAFARSTACISLVLWTVEGLKAALHLYRGKGFELTDEKLNSDWAPRPSRSSGTS